MLLYAGGAINGGSSRTDIPSEVKPCIFTGLRLTFTSARMNIGRKRIANRLALLSVFISCVSMLNYPQ